MLITTVFGKELIMTKTKDNTKEIMPHFETVVMAYKKGIIMGWIYRFWGLWLDRNR